MLVDRKSFATHLSHIYCEGLLPDAVLFGQFQGNGASVDRQVMVIAGAVDKADPLPDEIGVTNLEVFIKVLDSMEDDQVSLSVEDRFIVIAAHDRTFRLVTSAPRVIGTRIDDALKDRVLALISPTAAWQNLEHRFVDGVKNAVSILRAEMMTLHVTPTGSTLTVGDSRLNAAQFDLPDVKSGSGFGEYNLLLSKTAFIPVLKQLTDFTKAQMCLTGPDSVIAIREGSYLYVVSPDSPAAADGK